MMRSSNSKIQGKVEAVNSDSPLENGLPPKEEEDDMGQNVRELAAKVVDNVVKMASEAAQKRTPEHHHSTTKNRSFNIQRLPTIQIDTVLSPPASPDELTPPDEANELEEPLNESDIQLDLDTTTEQESDNSSEDLKELLKSYVEDIVSQAMVVAEKKLQFAGLPEDEDEDEEQSEPVQSSSAEPAEEPEKEIDQSEIRATAEQVVQEVITKASETVAEKLENGVAGLSFPGLPSFMIDTIATPPPSPESEEEVQQPQKKWSFKVEEESESEKELPKELEKESETPGLPSIMIDTIATPPPSPESEEEVQQPQKKWSFKVKEDSESGKELPKGHEKKPATPALITFDEAPDEAKEAATRFVKEIVGRAITMAEEKSVPTVPFNFDVDLMKTSGPWYIRAREALIRLLRTACFCTPRRAES